MMLAFILAAQVSAAPLAQGDESSYPPGQAPARLSPAIQAADAAMRDLQQRLSARLQEELKKGGPAQALSVCRDEAQALTAETARAQGIRVGRSSHRLRNPGNAAPPWAEKWVRAGASKKAALAEAVVVDLGDRVGVLRPLPTAAVCTQCHGAAERLSPEVKAFLAISYPQDRATGFEEGDLRGFVWAEAPVVATPAKAATTPLAEVSRGRELFGEANPRCTVCHSITGKGNLTGIALDGVGRRLTREEIKAWIRDPVAMAKKRASTKKPPMLPYPEFSDEELDALVAYLASLGPGPGRP